MNFWSQLQRMEYHLNVEFRWKIVIHASLALIFPILPVEVSDAVWRPFTSPSIISK